MVGHFSCYFLQVGVFRFGDFSETVGDCIFNEIVLTEDVVLMYGSYSLDKMRWANYPSAAYSSCCEDFSS